MEAAIALDGLLEIVDLFPRNIAGNIPAVFVALVVKVRAFRALANNAEAASVDALNLGDALKDGFGSGFGVHYAVVYAIHIYQGNKK